MKFYDDLLKFLSLVRKPCVIYLSIPCHWNRMVIFCPQVLHLTPDFRIIKIQSFVLSDKLNLAFHLPSSLHTSSFFWNNANVPIWPKKWLIFLNFFTSDLIFLYHKFFLILEAKKQSKKVVSYIFRQSLKGRNFETRICSVPSRRSFQISLKLSIFSSRGTNSKDIWTNFLVPDL